MAINDYGETINLIERLHRRFLDVLRAEEGFGKREAPPARNVRRAIVSLADGVRRFNERWSLYLDSLSLEDVHDDLPDPRIRDAVLALEGHDDPDVREAVEAFRDWVEED